jgi:excinuclease ABC subunit C
MPGKKVDQSFALLPDLLMVDGGKGQLARAVSVLDQFNLSDVVPVVSLAKQNEELFTPNRPNALLLPRQAQSFYLVQRIRDEAHRFAITAHRNRRAKAGIASRLDTVPGIGPAKRKVLLTRFGSVDDIRDATIEELTAVPGITPGLAQALKDHLD